MLIKLAYYALALAWALVSLASPMYSSSSQSESVVRSWPSASLLARALAVALISLRDSFFFGPLTLMMFPRASMTSSSISAVTFSPLPAFLPSPLSFC